MTSSEVKDHSYSSRHEHTKASRAPIISFNHMTCDLLPLVMKSSPCTSVLSLRFGW